MIKLDSKTKEVINNLPELRKYQSSILEVAGFPHYENVISNLLAYYFDFQEQHGLDDLFIKSLFFNLKLGKEYVHSENIAIHREVLTSNNKRIDLLIELDNYVIVIENKIFHTLNNPLTSYSKYIEKKYPNRRHIGVILSLYPVKLKRKSLFKSVIYDDFRSSVLERIGKYLTTSNNFHASFVTDFLTTLDNLKHNSVMNDEVLEYMAVHYEEFVKIQKLLTVYFKEINQKLNTLDKLLDLEEYVVSKEKWRSENVKSRLHNTNVYYLRETVYTDVKNLHLKIRLSPEGWIAELWGTNELPERKKIYLSSFENFKKTENDIEYVVIRKASYKTHPSKFKHYIEMSVKEMYKYDYY